MLLMFRAVMAPHEVREKHLSPSSIEPHTRHQIQGAFNMFPAWMFPASDTGREHAARVEAVEGSC